MKSLLFSTLVLSASTSFASGAAPASFTYQGKLFKANGLDPVESSSVDLKIQIRTPDGQCLLFEETHHRDMRDTNGIFSIIIGEGSNTNTSTLNLSQTFDNVSAKTGAAACAYQPVTGDIRRIRFSYVDVIANETVALPNDQTVRSVPYAMNSTTLGGLNKYKFIQVTSDTTQVKVDSLTAVTTDLLSLVAGTSNTYVKASDLPISGGVLNLSSGGIKVSDSPAAGDYAVNKNYSDSRMAGKSVDLTGLAQGQILSWNVAQNKWVAVSQSAATMTSITAGAGLTGGTITASGTIALATVGTAGTYAKVTTDAYGRVTAGAALAESDFPAMTTAGKVSGNAINAGTIAGSTAINTTGAITTTGNLSAANISTGVSSAQSLRLFNTGNTHKATITVPANLPSDYSLVLPSDDGSSGQILSTDGSGNLSWSSPSAVAVTGVSATLPVVVTGTLSPSISVNAATTTTTGIVQLASNGGTTASTVVQATDSRLTNSRAPSGAASGDLAGTFPSPTVASIRGTAVSAVAPADGQVYRYNGTSLAPSFMNISDLKDSLGNRQVPSSCTASDTLTYSVMTDSFSCTPIVVTSSNISNLGTASSKNVPASGNATAAELVLGSDTRLSNSRTPSGSSGGDLSGTFPNPTVARVQGVAYSATAPASGQIYRYNGTSLIPAFINASDLKTAAGSAQIPNNCTTSQTLSYSVMTDSYSCADISIAASNITGLGNALGKSAPASGNAASGELVLGSDTRLSDSRTPSGSAGGDFSGTYPNPTVARVQGIPYSATAPASGQIYRFNGTTFVPAYINSSDLKTAAGASQIPNNCSASQTFSYSVMSDSYSCVDIAISASNISGMGNALSRSVASTGNAASNEIVVGSDTRLTDARIPTGSAGGDFTGTFPNPTLATTGVSAGTYTKMTVDTKGRVTSATNLTASDVPNLSWAKLTSGVPTSISGYGITDAVQNAGSVPSFQAGADASRPAFGTAGRIYISTDLNRIYRDTGSAWAIVSSAAGSGGTVTSVVSGTGLVASTINATGTINVDVGTTANKIVQLDANAKLPAVDGSALTGVITPVMNGMLIFNANDTWTPPAGITKVYVQVWGSGGGGAGGTTGLTAKGGSGGSAGGYAQGLITLTNSNAITITVPAGGAKGAVAANGSNGSAASFGGYLQADGGLGGVASATNVILGGTSSAIIKLDGGVGIPALGSEGGVGGASPNIGLSAYGSFGSANPGATAGTGGGGGGGYGSLGAASTGGVGGAARVIIMW